MFDYREFLMKGFRNAVGKQADYQIIFNANGYFEKGVLTETDLADLQQMIDEKNAVAEDIVSEEVSGDENADTETDVSNIASETNGTEV